MNWQRLVEKAFSAAGLEYRVVGGLATYLYVEEAEPDAGRLTKDIVIAVRREDLRKIAEAVEPFGLQYRHVAGIDMLVQAEAPGRSVAGPEGGTPDPHRRKVRGDYVEPTSN